MLQRWWEKIKETEKKIILCGSIISTIYKISMGYGAALYGRKTLEMQITPLKFKFLKNFFPNYSFEQLVQAYAILGGIPRYLEEFDPKVGIKENVKNKILNKTSFLYNEPLNLLFEEFRSPAPYVSILLAVTQGYTKFAEIAEVSKIQSHKLPKYLLILKRVGLIEKEIPITEKKIKDNFYRFWFKFVFKNKSLIEQGLEKEVFDSIEKELNAYVGKVFEDVCREFIIDSQVFRLTKIGRWWHKDKEIDIVALNDQTKEALFAECKWQDKLDARKVLNDLKEKAKGVKLKRKKEIYAIFAKSFKEKFKEPGILLFDLDDLKRFLM
jgi:AAA+ ATPase superfamily predicted ATPase